MKKIGEQMPEALNRMTDKVLNYRPKDRQPKPPKAKRKKKPLTEKKNDPS